MRDESFFDIGLLAGAHRNAPFLLPWPVPGNPGGIIEFSTASQWQTFVLSLSLAIAIDQLAVEFGAHLFLRIRPSLRSIDGDINEALGLSRPVQAKVAFFEGLNDVWCFHSGVFRLSPQKPPFQEPRCKSRRKMNAFRAYVLRRQNWRKPCLRSVVAQLLTFAIPMVWSPEFIRLHRTFYNIFKVQRAFSGLMVFAGICRKPHLYVPYSSSKCDSPGLYGAHMTVKDARSGMLALAWTKGFENRGLASSVIERTIVPV